MLSRIFCGVVSVNETSYSQLHMQPVCLDAYIDEEFKSSETWKIYKFLKWKIPSCHNQNSNLMHPNQYLRKLKTKHMIKRLC